MADGTVKKSSKLLIGLVWLVVIVPLTWGLTFTVQNAMKLFAPTATAPAPSVAPVVKPATK